MVKARPAVLLFTVLAARPAGGAGTARRPVKFAVPEPARGNDFELQGSRHRRGKSLVVVLCYQDRLHFYYAHLSVGDGSHSAHNGLFKGYDGRR